VVLYLATNKHMPQTFEFFISKVGEEYTELAVKEYNLNVDKAISYIANARLLPHLTRHYKMSDRFVAAVL
jgi:hypothetical protein